MLRGEAFGIMKATTSEGFSVDMAVILGLVVGIGGILLGNAIEGGHFGALIQGAAFVIVFLGTAGATILSNKSADLKRSWSLFMSLFGKGNEEEYAKATAEILDCARLARKETILALEAKAKTLSHPFTREVVASLTDGTDPEIIEEIFLEKIHREEQRLNAAAKVWTDAGGYAPTIGIIGAVLGLIHVMSNISDTSKLGSGIAVAFVATIYGVGIANLIFLPLGSRLKKVAQDQVRLREMILSGALGIPKGLTPTLIEVKLSSFRER